MSSTVSKRRLHGALKPDKTGYSDEPNVTVADVTVIAIHLCVDSGERPSMLILKSIVDMSTRSLPSIQCIILFANTCVHKFLFTVKLTLQIIFIRYLSV